MQLYITAQMHYSMLQKNTVFYVMIMILCSAGAFQVNLTSQSSVFKYSLMACLTNMHLVYFHWYCCERQEIKYFQR